MRIGGLSDLAADTEANPDPIAHGFPPVDERFIAPCMKNSTDRACTSEGECSLPHITWLLINTFSLKKLSGQLVLKQVSLNLMIDLPIPMLPSVSWDWC